MNDVQSASTLAKTHRGRLVAAPCVLVPLGCVE